MCHQKIHHCKYHQGYYICTKKDVFCPTLNGDANANLCEPCEEIIWEKAQGRDNDNEDEVENH